MLRARADLHGPFHPEKRLRLDLVKRAPSGHHQRHGRGQVLRRPVLQQRVLRQGVLCAVLKPTAKLFHLAPLPPDAHVPNRLRWRLSYRPPRKRVSSPHPAEGTGRMHELAISTAVAFCSTAIVTLRASLTSRHVRRPSGREVLRFELAALFPLPSRPLSFSLSPLPSSRRWSCWPCTFDPPNRCPRRSPLLVVYAGTTFVRERSGAYRAWR